MYLYKEILDIVRNTLPLGLQIRINYFFQNVKVDQNVPLFTLTVARLPFQKFQMENFDCMLKDQVESTIVVTLVLGMDVLKGQ